jgi:hypothetical protein
MRSFLTLIGLALATLNMSASTALAACPFQEDIRANARFCFGQPQEGWWGDLVTGSCDKDASKTHSAFFSCQGDGGIRDR